MEAIQSISYEAYKSSGKLIALLNDNDADPDSIGEALDKVSAQFESGAVTLRNFCERHHPGIRDKGKNPLPPHIDLAGKAEVNEYGWLHIELNALLPNSRFHATAYLTDTISRLLDEYESRGHTMPRFDNVMLIIDEHCDIDSRQVYDQDNKGWKAIPNALKGRVIKDDDQFTLNVALISTRSLKTACHIYLLPQDETGEFFNLRYGNYPLFP